MKFIDKIDNYFYSKKLKEILMIYMLIVISIVFVIFYFIFPYAKKYRDNELKSFNNSKIQLQTLKNRNNILNLEIFNLNKQIKELRLNNITLKKQKDFFDELISLLDFTEFNRYKWGNFVKNLIINAKKEGLSVLGFTNKIYKKQTGLINKKMEINIKVKGEYKNVIYFIYKYENIKDLLRVEGFNIDKNNIYEIKFILYGNEK